MTFQEKQELEILKIISKPEHMNINQDSIIILVSHFPGHVLTIDRIRTKRYILQTYDCRITDLGRAALKELINRKRLSALKR